MPRTIEQLRLLLASLSLPVVALVVGLSIASERWQPLALGGRAKAVRNPLPYCSELAISRACEPSPEPVSP
jgi:hypothetical protein